MLQGQQNVAAWVTEQKHVADTLALNGQHMLAKDKGACARGARATLGEFLPS